MLVLTFIAVWDGVEELQDKCNPGNFTNKDLRYLGLMKTKDQSNQVSLETLVLQNVLLQFQGDMGVGVQYIGPSVCFIFTHSRSESDSFFLKQIKSDTPLIPYTGLMWPAAKHAQECRSCTYNILMENDIIVCSNCMGGIARFVNSDCSPNCRVEWVAIAESERKLPLLISNCEIHKGNASGVLLVMN